MERFPGVQKRFSKRHHPKWKLEEVMFCQIKVCEEGMT